MVPKDASRPAQSDANLLMKYATKVTLATEPVVMSKARQIPLAIRQPLKH